MGLLWYEIGSGEDGNHFYQHNHKDREMTDCERITRYMVMDTRSKIRQYWSGGRFVTDPYDAYQGEFKDWADDCYGEMTAAGHKVVVVLIEYSRHGDKTVVHKVEIC